MGGPALAGVLGITPEEADLFISNYFKSLPGLKESFDKVRNHAVKNGWIRICEYTDKRYFFRDFDRMNKLQEQAMSYYPDDYRTYTPEQRAAFKEELYENYPEVKQLWRDYMGLKGTLERRAVNFSIQGASAVQLKASLIYMYNRISDLKEDWSVNLPTHDELLGYTKDEKYLPIIHDLMIKGAKYNCKVTPIFAEMACDSYWVH